MILMMASRTNKKLKLHLNAKARNWQEGLIAAADETHSQVTISFNHSYVPSSSNRCRQTNMPEQEQM